MDWTLRYSRRADSDLIDIWAYIFTDNPAAADRHVLKLAETFEAVQGFPEKGRPAPELSENHRILTYGSYMLIYEIDRQDKVVTLIRVLHAARDWRTLFDD
ncbi:type II toxin-antitoxin system RelE/ParE family toxin [Asticcacaulis solisilvae]|uniref:type II toxin-antitoxin system RelE/ParE family toxin n=1 Tax=Asticcacaulis solisilvae TaxID=1217274 RepID=UPI003FD76AF3